MIIFSDSLKASMDLIQSYTDQNDDKLNSPEDQTQNPNSTSSSPEASPPRLLAGKSAAPKVDDTMLALTAAQAHQVQSKPIDRERGDYQKGCKCNG